MKQALFKHIAVLTLLLSACLGLAQSIPIEYPPTIAIGGSLSVIEFTGAGGDNQQMPNQATYNTSVAAPGTGMSVQWSLTRKKGYNRVSGTLYPLGSAEGVYSVSHGWGGSTRTIDFQAGFWSWFSSRPTEEARYGEFSLDLLYDPDTATAPVTVNVMTFTLRPQDYASGGQGNTNGLNNGGNTAGGGGPMNIWDEAAGTFWHGLFVPSEDAFNDLKAAVDDIKTWGPFGLLFGQNSWFIEPSGYSSYATDLAIPISIPGSGPISGTYSMNLAPYEPVIKFCRTIIYGVFVWVFFAKSWAMVATLIRLGGPVVSGLTK